MNKCDIPGLYPWMLYDKFDFTIKMTQWFIKKCRKCEKITKKLQTKCDQNGTLLQLGIPAKRKGRQLFNKISKKSGSNLSDKFVVMSFCILN